MNIFTVFCIILGVIVIMIGLMEILTGKYFSFNKKANYTIESVKKYALRHGLVCILAAIFVIIAGMYASYDFSKIPFWISLVIWAGCTLALLLNQKNILIKE